MLLKNSWQERDKYTFTGIFLSIYLRLFNWKVTHHLKPTTLLVFIIVIIIDLFKVDDKKIYKQ